MRALVGWDPLDVGGCGDVVHRVSCGGSHNHGTVNKAARRSVTHKTTQAPTHASHTHISNATSQPKTHTVRTQRARRTHSDHNATQSHTPREHTALTAHTAKTQSAHIARAHSAHSTRAHTNTRTRTHAHAHTHAFTHNPLQFTHTLLGAMATAPMSSELPPRLYAFTV